MYSLCERGLARCDVNHRGVVQVGSEGVAMTTQGHQPVSPELVQVRLVRLWDGKQTNLYNNSPLRLNG